MDIPAWLLLALLSPFFWAVVHVFDSYCVDKVFDRPWVGCVTGAVATACVLPFLAAGFLAVGWVPVSPISIAVAVGAGALFMVSQALYFQALAWTESGIIAAYWNLIPVVLLGAGYLAFGELLSVPQCVGIGVLVVVAVLFSLLDGNLVSRWSSLLLMLVAVGLQVGYILIQKEAFAGVPVFQFFVLSAAGIFLAGLSPVFLRGGRRVLRGNWPRIRPVFRVLVVIEVANLAALATSQFAVSLGPPSLVSAVVEACIPVYTFFLSAVFYAVSRRYGEEEARQRLPAKLLLIAAMAFGVWLVS